MPERFPVWIPERFGPIGAVVRPAFQEWPATEILLPESFHDRPRARWPRCTFGGRATCALSRRRLCHRLWH